MQNLFGLIGYPLAHSFSKAYFTEKFKAEGWKHCRYELFPLENIEALPSLLEAMPDLRGLNVTLPYKQTVMRYLDEIDGEAAAVGAVNTIVVKGGKRKGYNTDVFGFEQSLREWIGNNRPDALVLGTGGAARAVMYVLSKMGISYLCVSRSAEKGDLTYQTVTQELLAGRPLVINTTPLGMYPATDTFPPLPYEAFGKDHFAFDLVYNPEQTLFLSKAAANGASTRNGLQMLQLQAERAWEIWEDGRMVAWLS